jgi:hypothetical protein
MSTRGLQKTRRTTICENLVLLKFFYLKFLKINIIKSLKNKILDYYQRCGIRNPNQFLL